MQVRAKECNVATSLTIRADEEILNQLEELARDTNRSRNFHATQALKEYLLRRDSVGSPRAARVPIAECFSDYQSRLWVEDDTDDFIGFLRRERQSSRDKDRVSGLE